MPYLDVAPMMTALRSTPEDFRIDRAGFLRHGRSRHSFSFDNGNVRVYADCNCALLSVSPEQRRALFDAYQDWQRSYWMPLQINKEFASHFRPRSPLRRLLIALAARLHGWAIREERDAGRAEGLAPAE